jgi:hypothetical protein
LPRAYAAHIGGRFECETLFVIVDFVALYGKLLMSKRLTAKTRRIGKWSLVVAGSASLACNVAAGILRGSLGAAFYGTIIIVGVVGRLEYVVANTKAKATYNTNTPRTPKAPALAKRSTRACAPGCGCGKYKARYPVSPGVGPVGDYAGRVA